MAVTEKQRHERYNDLQRVHGPQHADDLHRLRRDMVTWVLTAVGIQTAVIGLLVGLVS